MFGYPDEHSQGRMMKWDKAGLNCLLNDKDEAIELRFEKPSKAVTAGGVTFRMRLIKSTRFTETPDGSTGAAGA
jgi:hypothetical protein